MKPRWRRSPSKKLRRDLKPVFQTRVRRRVFQLARRERGRAQHRQGNGRAGRHSSPLCEVELELKHGQPADLFEPAKSLAGEVPVQLAVQSKADRGYALMAAAKPEAMKAAPVALAPDIDVQSAFKIIAQTCLHQLVANQPVVLGGDPEGVHQMRARSGACGRRSPCLAKCSPTRRRTC